ncbi:hypothetical protein LTR94_027561, partial [Friedmanniomyces endolithicus]
IVAIIQQVKDSGLLPEKGAIGLDPEGVGALVDALAEIGLVHPQVVGVTQGYRLASAVWSLERKLKHRMALHSGAPIINWCVGNAKAEQRGNAVIITKQAAGKAKIDLFIAGLNATKLLEANPTGGMNLLGMTGYKLSARAAAAEQRWRGPSERKDVQFGRRSTLQAGAQDGDNFRTNRITVAEYNDAGGAHGVLGLATTWACVNFIAGTIASLPLTVYHKGPGGVPVEATDHHLYRLLHNRPNFDQSAFDFWEYLAASIELHGNAYAEISFGSGGRIIALTPVRPDIMSVSRLVSGDIEYRWTDNGRPREVTQAAMLHIRGFGGSPLGGLSPLSVCRRSFASASSVESAAAKIFSNGVLSSGVITKDG